MCGAKWCLVFTRVKLPSKKGRGACHIFLGLKKWFGNLWVFTASEVSQALAVVPFRVLS